MVDFMEDYLRTLRFLQDPANHDETVALLAQVTKREPSFYQDWVFTKRDYFRDSRALPNLEALQANINLQKTLGFVRAEVEVDKHADLSLVKEAAARLDNKSGR
jgi:NitT/TauT family transport system substrate-binding protein